MRQSQKWKVWVTLLTSLHLGACFKAVTSSSASNTRSKTKVTTLTAAAESETKSVASINFAATETQTVSVSGQSNISGTSVAISPGSLNISTNLILEEGASFQDTGVSGEIALAGDQAIAQASTGVIIRPSTEATLTKPLQLSLPLPSTFGLKLRAQTYYAIAYKYLDPTLGQLLTGIKPVDGVDVALSYDESSKKDVITFSGYFGVYWIVTLTKEMPKAEVPQPKVSQVPIVNKANVPVIATNGIIKDSEVVSKQIQAETIWTKPILSFDAATRNLSLNPVASNASLKNCRAEFYRSATDLKPTVSDLGSLSSAVLNVPSEGGTYLARYRCQDSIDRFTISPWTDAFNAPPVQIQASTGGSVGGSSSGESTAPGVGGVGGGSGVGTSSDTTSPVVLGVSSSMADGVYTTGDMITVEVSFSEPVTVTGTPNLVTNLSGGSGNVFNYTSGSGSSTLSFSLTITAGHQSSDLDYLSDSSLTGSIQDAAGNAAILALAPPGSSGSLSAAKQIVVSTNPATVVSLTTSMSGGTYGPGNYISFVVNFDRAVTITGTPIMALNTNTAANASMVSSTSTSITFAFTVPASLTSTNLAPASSSALTVSGGSIVDSNGLAANLAVPTIISPNIHIDGNATPPNLTTTMPTQNRITGENISVIDVNDQGGGDLAADSRNISYTCAYDMTDNNSMDAGGTNCLSLSGVSFNATTGVLNWSISSAEAIPEDQKRTYEFKIMGSTNANLLHWVYAKVHVIKSFSRLIGFDAGTQSSYTFDPAKVEFSSGLIKLAAFDQIDDSADANGFGTSGNIGVVYDPSISAIRAGIEGGCNGLLRNCFASDVDSWIPRKISLQTHSGFENTFDSLAVPSSPNNPTFITDSKVGMNAISFDGNDFLSLPTTYFENFTYNFWIKSPTQGTTTCSSWLNGNPLISTRQSTALTSVFGVSLCNGQIFAGYNAQTAVSAASPQRIDDNRWHMVTFVRDTTATKVRLYIDGMFASEATSGVDLLNGNATLYLGKDVLGSYFTGQLDEFSRWNAALTEAEVATLFARQGARTSGVFVSRQMDGEMSVDWNSLTIGMNRPYGKELLAPANSENISDYPAASSTLNVGMRSLVHFNVNSNAYTDESGANWSSSTMPTLVMGRFGKAIKVSGDGNIVLSNSNQAIYDFANTSFTASAWFRSNSASGFRRIMGNGFQNFSSGWVLSLIDKKIGFGMCPNTGGSATTCTMIKTNSDFADGEWHHVLGIVERSSGYMKLYVDGVPQAVGIDSLYGTCGTPNGTYQAITACSSLSANKDTNARATIGGLYTNTSPYYFERFDGVLDEVATWSKALSSAEIQDVFSRGRSRVLIQARKCSTPCTTEPFIGPEGDDLSYFSEIHNRAANVLPGRLTLNFPSFGSFPTASSRYFQYRLILETDYPDALQCTYGTTGPCSPEISKVEVGPVHYTQQPAPIAYNSALPYYTLSNLSEQGASCSSQIYYALSPNNTDFKYWTGSSWIPTSGDFATLSTAASISSGMPSWAATFGHGQVYLKTFLRSDGLNPCQVDSLTIQGNTMH